MKTKPREIHCTVEGVTLLERTFKSKANSDTVTERLYRCQNGLSLGARRGGALTMSDGTTWEVFVLGENATMVGAPCGFVTDEQLVIAAKRLSAWTAAA